MITGVYKPTRAPSASTARTSRASRRTITARGIARTFQNIRLFPQMTALENVLVGMHSRCKARASGVLRRRPVARGGKQRERAPSCSAYFGLRPPRTCAQPPYGNQRRLEMARALATEPKLLLLDEPAAGMNPQETADFTDFVRSSATSAG